MTGQTYRALIVDDEKGIRAILEMALESPEWQADSVDSITKAEKLIAENKYDLIIADKNFPDGDGVSFLRQVRELYPEVACVMITAYPSVDSAVATLNLDVDDYLVKPFDIINLSTKLRGLIEKRAANRRVGALSGAVAHFHRVREHLDQAIDQTTSAAGQVQLKILVVLTDAADRAQFDTLLRDSGHHIATFVTSKSTIESTKEPVDLIIADAAVSSPDIFGLLETMRTLGGQPEVVVVASAPKLSVVTGLMRIGIAQLIEKPIKRDKLGARIQAVIDAVRRRKAEREDL